MDWDNVRVSLAPARGRRFVACKLADYSLGIYASAFNLVTAAERDRTMFF
jgi:hypothetical protein